jgi:hypothetical protein
MRSIFRTFAICTLASGATLLLLATPGWSQQSDTTNGNATQQQPDTTTTDTTKSAAKPTPPAKFDTNAAKEEPDVVKRLDTSASVMNEIMGTPDKGDTEENPWRCQMHHCDSIDGEYCGGFWRKTRQRSRDLPDDQ